MISKLKEIVTRMEREQHRRITNKEIAKACDIRENTVSRWMNPAEPLGMIDPKVLGRLKVFTGVALDDLLVIEPLPQSGDN